MKIHCLNVVTFVFIILIQHVELQTLIRIMAAVESTETGLLNLLSQVISIAERKANGNDNDDVRIELFPIEVDRNDVENSYSKVCAELYNGITMILDMTYTGWDKINDLAQNQSIIYVRTASGIIPFIKAMNSLLTKKNATDVALIFESEQDLNKSLYYLIGNSIIRLVVIDELSDSTVSSIRDMRPSPSYYAIYSSTVGMEKLFKTAVQGNLVTRDNVWNLIFTDMNYKYFPYISGKEKLNVSVEIISTQESICCDFLNEIGCNCPTDFQFYNNYLENTIMLIITALKDVKKSGINLEPVSGKCNEINPNAEIAKKLVKAFNDSIEIATLSNPIGFYDRTTALITYETKINIEVLNNGELELLGNWTSRSDQVTPAPNKQIVPVKRFFRVGTTYALPWSTLKTDPTTGEVLKDENGNEIWEGYCIDFIQKLSETMHFDYELVIPADRHFGHKEKNGKWTGLVGDLARGETDIAIAALTMTSEREEVIDFVAPYFEQSGILIVMRKPERKTSLFKFMTVLRIEVWLCIVGALTLTAIMIWLLDKYSPYSARNNKRIYPYPCRDFTLKESFWFALTSFTPQGGGEAPKALSSRTLVAAYWLFVVLMLATFTANLAAFLTVERMQSQIQSLEQLARQSRINYTVVLNSSTHQYFTNMRNAEDKLYKVWKEITLNSSSDQVEYRVWDYPIKEQYGHILQTITSVGPVKDAAEGFKKVIDSENAEFAFIHDSSEIKYAVMRNCKLAEIGEVFAEQPYAVAVQQGSHLQEEISRKILDLQKNRYFETLSATYWNASLKGKCSVADENEGITLESLGGVFIATLFGLALAMITLAGEVIYYRKKNVNQAEHPKGGNVKAKNLNQKILKRITSKSKIQFKPAATVAFIGSNPRGVRPRVSHISVYPKPFPFKE